MTGAYRALFRRCGVSRVHALDELVATLLLFSQERPAFDGGLVSIHDSGGECELLCDLAKDIGVPIADIGEGTRTRLGQRLDPGLEPVNPLDAWGTGRDATGIFEDCLTALLADGEAGVGLIVSDPRDDHYHHRNLIQVAKTVASKSDKPLAFVANLSVGPRADFLETLASAGVPLLEGTREALFAVKHLLDYRDFTRQCRESPPSPPRAAVIARWRGRLSDGAPMSEVESLAMLVDFGVPVVGHHVVNSLDAAVAAAESLGYPVVLKTARVDLGHKSDVGGVRLDLRDDSAVAAAFAEISARHGPRVQVASQIRGGVELGLGVINDPQFGPYVSVATGGTLIEVLRDGVVAMAPVSTEEAARLTAELRSAPMLAGARGAAPADVGALSQAIARLSVMARSLADVIDQVDVNPLIAGPGGCVAVDALVVPKDKTEEQAS